MKVLVVGDYPPVPGPEARATLASVRSLVREGHEVHVVSPEPGAAHEHDHLAGLGAAWALARRARRHDSLVIHIEPGLPLRAGTGRSRRTAECAALARAFARYSDVTVHLRDLRAIPGSVGGRSGRLLWRNVQRVVVDDDADRWFIHHHGGVPLDRIATRHGELPPGEAPPFAAGGGVADPPSWRTTAVEYTHAVDEIHRRAAARRAAAGPEVVAGAAVRSLTPPPKPPPGMASALTRLTLKRALGRRAPTVAASVRRLRARLRPRG